MPIGALKCHCYCAYPGQAWQLVVHHGGHVELQQLHVLGDDVGRRAALLVPPQLVVDLDYVGQLVCQVVLGDRERDTTRLNDDGKTNELNNLNSGRKNDPKVNKHRSILDISGKTLQRLVILPHLVTGGTLHDAGGPDS